MRTSDIFFMEQALREAEKAREKGEVPVGAVLVKGTRIIARAYNRSITDHDPSGHAEIVVLRKAGRAEKCYRLIDATLYTTLEPCPMCAGALVHARIKRLVYGARDPKAGACGTVFKITGSKLLNHRIPVTAGILEKECADLMKDFFRNRRRKF